MALTHYAVLGVQRNTLAVDVRAAYLKLAQEHHPDRGGDLDKFRLINEAYNVLCNETTRTHYNRNLDARHPACQPCHGTGTVYEQRGFTGRIGKRCKPCGGSGVIVP